MLTFAAKQVFGKEELRKVIIFLKIPPTLLFPTLLNPRCCARRTLTATPPC